MSDKQESVKSLFGDGATVTMDTTSNSEMPSNAILFQDLVSKKNDPNDYGKFLHDLFESDEYGQVMTDQVTNVYKFWSNTTCEGHTDELLKVMLESKCYKNNRCDQQDKVLGCRKKVFSGIRLRPIVWKLPLKPTEFDNFIVENLIVDCSARVGKKKVEDLYKKWKYGNTNEPLNKDMKKQLHSYLEKNFINNPKVWLGAGEGQKNGYLGIGVADELHGVGLHPVKKPRIDSKMIGIRDIETGGFQCFDTQANLAARFKVSSPLIAKVRNLSKQNLEYYYKNKYRILENDELKLYIESIKQGPSKAVASP